MATNSDTYSADPPLRLDMACSEQTLARYRELYEPEEADTPEPDTRSSRRTTATQSKKPSDHEGRMDRFAYFFERCISIGFIVGVCVVLLYTIVYAFAAAD
ncbi:MAG: hypothetical protein AAGB26_08930 [Planctomycetota bacterium]